MDMTNMADTADLTKLQFESYNENNYKVIALRMIFAVKPI